MFTLIAAATIAIAVVVALTWRLVTRTEATKVSHASLGANANELLKLPESGLLVANDVLRAAGVSATTVWEALESAAVPIGLEYFPVTEAEITRYRTVPISAAQQSLVNIVKALDPKSPTLYRVVLPRGAELVKATGASGFRGFAQSGGKITAQALLKPVAAGGAIAAGWPVFAVAGTVMAMDMAAQRELRTHQRRVEATLRVLEQHQCEERLKDQRTADTQLTRAISLLLDGRSPRLELALKSADDEFHRSQLFLDKYQTVLEQLVEGDGKVDYRRLEKRLGGEFTNVLDVLQSLHLARGGIAIQRKALLTEATSAALADPGNPYTTLRRFVEARAHQLEEADRVATAMTQQFAEIQLKGGWSVPKALEKQEQLRTLAAPAQPDEDTELRFLRTVSGEIVQVIAIETENRGGAISSGATSEEG